MQRTSLRFAHLAATSSLLRDPSKASISFSETVAAYNAAGADVAATSTKEFLKLQSELIPYRIVRLNEELKAARELGLGGSLPNYATLMIRCVMLFIIYTVGYTAGRRSFFAKPLPPPTADEFDLNQKAFQERQAKISEEFELAKEKHVARLEKEKAKEEKYRASIAASIAAGEERRLQKALSRERGY